MQYLKNLGLLLYQIEAHRLHPNMPSKMVSRQILIVFTAQYDLYALQSEGIGQMKHYVYNFHNEIMKDFHKSTTLT